MAECGIVSFGADGSKLRPKLRHRGGSVFGREVATFRRLRSRDGFVDRLATVGEQTNFVMNDYEYDLTMTYDDDELPLRAPGPENLDCLAVLGIL